MTAKKNDDTALATTEPAGALAIPDWMREDKEALALDTDFENTDVKIPQMKIAQGQTPERKRSDPNYIQGLEEGDLFNNISGKVYGMGPLRFVVLKFWTNILNQKPLDEGGGMICRAPGTDCACSQALDAGKLPAGTQWGPKGEKPQCTRFMNYLLFLIDHNEVVWYSAKSTAAGVMKQLNTSLRGIAGIPDFAKIFTLSTAAEKNGAGLEYFAPTIPRLPAGIVTDQALYTRLKMLAKDLTDKTIDTSEAADEDEGPANRAAAKDVPF
jgi:hypothetical protein